MPDIAKCAYDKCPSRKKCYRYMAIPSELGQAYGQFAPDKGKDKCEFFWPNKEMSNKPRKTGYNAKHDM